MAQNLPEIGALFGHSFRSSLAKSDAMSLARSFQKDLIAFFLHQRPVSGFSSGLPCQLPQRVISTSLGY